MTIGEMHYDFKQKLNAIDSQKYRNLRVPEIDWKLNEAIEVLCISIAQPSYKVNIPLGFEINQRTIDDIRTIVIDQKPTEYSNVTQFDDSSFIMTLPDNYWYLANLTVLATKGNCINVNLYNSKAVQHNDNHESSIFDKSSFEWRTSNYRFNKDGIRFFTDGTFIITKIGIEYLIKPKMVHNAKDFIGGTYNTIDGVPLTGSEDTDLPEQVHRDIVDIAVAITANDLSLPQYNYKKDKLNFKRV